MDNNNTIPAELKKRIEKEAKGEIKKLPANNTFEIGCLEGYYNGYIAGATEYAIWKVRYDNAKKLLERLMDNHNATLPSEQLYNEIKSFLDGSK